MRFLLVRSSASNRVQSRDSRWAVVMVCTLRLPSGASMHFNLCDLPTLQAAIEMLHRKAGRFRQRGNVLHCGAATSATRRRKSAVTAASSRGRVLRALSHDARAHIPPAKTEQNSTVRVRTYQPALTGGGEAMRSAAAATDIPPDQRRPMSSSTMRTITMIPMMPTPP
jgi:hypothetical protein